MVSEAHAIVKEEHLLRDTRHITTRIGVFLQERRSATYYLALAVFALALPGAGPVALVFTLLGLLVFTNRTIHLPIELPVHTSAKLDPHGINKKTLKPMPDKPQGIYFLGNAIDDGAEIWTSQTTETEHTAYLASTGGGKTAGLTSKLVNTFIQGSGAMYTDGKAQPDVPIRIASLAHRFGRLVDCNTINFIAGGTSAWQRGETLPSHSLSLLQTGSATMVAEIFKSLIVVDGDVWGKRALFYATAVAYMTTYLRDTGAINPTYDFLNKMMELRFATKIALRDDVPREAKGLLEVYIRNLPEITEEMIQKLLTTGTVAAEVERQHGFITMQVVPTTAEMEFEYGHIFSQPVGDINLDDVILNDRIVTILLPALEKSADTTMALGRLIVASVKAIMAKSIFMDLEGSTSRLDAMSTNSDTPFPIIWDEVGYYMVDDHAVKAAQARSLNIAEHYGAQDIAAMKRAGEKAASATLSVLANTNQKAVGRLEDAAETMPWLKERLGEEFFAEQSSLERDTSGVAGSYHSNQVSLQRRAQITLRKLAALGQGHCYLIWRGQIVRMKTFYAEPRRIDKFKLNRYVTIHDVDVGVLVDQGIANIKSGLIEVCDKSVRIPAANDNEYLKQLITGIESANYKSITTYLEQQHKDRIQAYEDILNVSPAPLGINVVDNKENAPTTTEAAHPKGGVSRKSQEGSKVGKAKQAHPAESVAAKAPRKTVEAPRYQAHINLLFAHLGEDEETFKRSLYELEGLIDADDEAEGAWGAEKRVDADMRSVGDSLTHPTPPTPQYDPEALTKVCDDLSSQLVD